MEVHDRILEQVKNCILESMKSLTVITALPLTSDKMNQLMLKDEDMLVPFDVVRSTVLKVLPLTGALNKKLLTSQQTKERFGPWLNMYEFLDRYDISLSYHKGPQDEELALAMFTMLSNFSCGSKLRAVEVFLDEKRLQHGKRSQDDFIQSIVNSTIVVPIFSVDALAKIVTHDPSVVDSILLEWICAIEGYKSDYSRIKYIYPLFRGKEDPVTGKVGSVFDSEEFKQISDDNIIPHATLSAAESLLTENKIFSIVPTGFGNKTVKSIVTTISEFKGLSVDGDKQKNFLTRCAENLMKMLDNQLSKVRVMKSTFVVMNITNYNSYVYIDDLPAPVQKNPLSERSLLSGRYNLSSVPTDYKPYSDEERLMKLEAESENAKKRIPINNEKIESTEYNVIDDFDDSQQQSKQNQKDQLLDLANQQMNDNSAALAQLLEKVKKELIQLYYLLFLAALGYALATHGDPLASFMQKNPLSEDSSVPTDYKPYSDEERLMKLEAESENTKKRISINDEKIKSTEYNVSDDFDNSQQQSKQNQKDQFLDLANQQMNDNSATLAQLLEKVKKEGL